jgi:hypothetical protein
VGAQAAALLDAAMHAGAPVGDVPPPWTPAGSVHLDAPASYSLGRTALSHGGVGLAPAAWDGARLHLRLPGPVVVRADLTVAWRDAPPDVAVLRRVLAIDDDVEPLWQACDAVPALRWVRTSGTGRLLRSPSVWQDVIGVLAQVRSSYRGAQARMRALVGDGAFPSAGDVARRDALPGWGFRASWALDVARRIDDGAVDPERWLDPALPDDEVHAELTGLPGVGAFSAAQLMPLLGRPRPMVCDGWLREQLGGDDDAALRRRFAAMGRWAGTGAWLHALASRLR